MKLIKKVAFETAVFTLAINTLYLIAALFIYPNLTELPSIDIIQHFVIMILSFVIALANRIFEVEKLHRVLKVVINYTVILVSFIVLFSSWRPDSFASSSAFFVAIFLFTVAYALVFAGIMIGKKIYAKSKLSKPAPVAKPKANKKNEEAYKPRFK